MFGRKKLKLMEGEKVLFEGKGAAFDEPSTSTLNMAKSNRIILTDKRLTLPLNETQMRHMSPLRWRAFLREKKDENPWFGLEEVKEAGMAEIHALLRSFTGAKVTFRNGKVIYLQVGKGLRTSGADAREFVDKLNKAAEAARK